MATDNPDEVVYGIDYHLGRRTKRALRYRLRRRADEVQSRLQEVPHEGNWRALDLGTADGLMLQRMRGTIDASLAVGVDLSHDLLSLIGAPTIPPALADGHRLHFAANSFDLVVASAVIEHVSRPVDMLLECRRVLEPDGFVVVTTPDPFWERVATRVGHLPDGGHQETLDLKRLGGYLERAGFEVLEARNFMISPWGLPAEKIIESLLRSLGLGFMLLNQVALGKARERAKERG